MHINEEPFTVLYKLSKEPYTPNSYWCANGIYSTQYPNIKSDFKADPELDFVEFKLTSYPIHKPL
jgi:hypothetical protein